jgi:hypothetical protein
VHGAGLSVWAVAAGACQSDEGSEVMIRFVDCRKGFWADEDDDAPPVCIFIDTVSNTVVEGRVFFSMADVCGIHPPSHAERCCRLVPAGYFPDQVDRGDA